MKFTLRFKPSLQLVLLLALFLVSASAFAGESMPWDSGLKKFGDALTGPTAMYISLLAFAACMFGLIWGGEMSDVIKKMVIIVLAGSGLVGAASLAKNLLGVQVTGAVIDAFGVAQTGAAQHVGGLLGIC